MKHLLTTIMLLISFSSFAQLSVTGVVKDSIGNSLELANIIAINQSTNTMDSYGITNDKGRYKLDLKKNSSYKLQVSYIGMEGLAVIINTQNKNLSKNFTLKTDNTLEAIELTYEMPVTIKGDTIVYDADSFKNGTERKLEDVLKKLPGVDINDEGQVEVEGKVVSKVMVEGKEFFDGDSKLATKNIPADAIDKIEVLKNHADVGQLSSVQNNEDNIALNIKLKEGKKSFWFGTVTAGGGKSVNNELYLVQPKLFYYSPKYSINIIGDLNNLGEIAFTRRDYFNFTGGFRNPSRSSGTSLSLGDNSISFLTLENNKAKDINTKFGAANFSFSPKKTLDISGFGIFSSSRNELQENNSLHYVSTDLGIPDENTEAITHQKSDLAMLKLSAKYKPNSNHQLDYDVFGKLSKETQEQQTTSSVLGGINQLDDSSPYSINQTLNYYYTHNDKNIFSFEAQHVFKNEDPFYNAFLEEQTNYSSTAGALGLNNLQSGYTINQEKQVKSNQLDAKIDYWNVLNDKSNINITLGNLYSAQEFNSNMFQTLDNGTVFNPTPIINDGLNSNDNYYLFNDSYIGLHYRVKVGKFTFTPGVSAHAYNTVNQQGNTDNNNSFFRVLPDFNTRIQLKKSENISLNYSMKTNFTDITTLAKGLVLNKYNSLYSGEPMLENALTHNISLSYFSFNLFNYTNVFAHVNYSKKINGIQQISNFEPGSVVSVNTPHNSNFSDESLFASGRFQRSFGKFRATASANFNYAKFNSVTNSVTNINENYTQTYKAQFRTNFKTAPNVELSYKHTIQDNDLGNTRIKYYTKSPSINFDAYIWKTITFKTDYTYTDFSSSTENLNTFEFWNASISYRKNQDSKWEYELKASNLLNTNAQNSSNSNSTRINETTYYIQPRFVSFRMIYNL